MASTESETVNTLPSCEQPAPHGRTLLFLLLAFVAGIVLADRMSQPNGDGLTAYLRAESVVVKAKQDGYIKTIISQPGTTLNASVPVVELENEKLRSEIIDAQQEVTRRQAELEQTRARAEVDLSWRLKELETETLDTRLKSATLLQGKHMFEMENVAWRDYVEKFDGLASSGGSDDLLKSLIYSSSLTADESRIRAILRQEAARNAVEVNAVKIELCESRLSGLKTLKSELPKKIRQSAGIEVAQARLAQATELLNRLEQRATQLTLTAPAYGTVGKFQKDIGDAVRTGDPIVEILDEDRLFLEARIPSDQVPAFPQGTTVVLRFPGDEQRTGRVTGISAGSKADQDSIDANAPEHIATLRIDPSGELWPSTLIGSSIEVIAAD